ncbi:MAG TPA: NAD-dependent epimerase/dehydratase family protein [Candidatus Dormibacteraeota bacterium]|jgi:UDP-glucose 4-epimerase
MPSRKRRVLVTGVARWWGALLVQRLVEEPGVEEVVGIDTEDPHHDLGDADFLKLDIRHSLVGKLVRAVGIDTVVHTQISVDSHDRDPRRAHETNVIGSLNLLAGLAGEDTPVRRVVLKSSAHVYGARHDLPTRLREDRRLAASSPHSFVRDVVETEANLHDFAVLNPDVETISLRFANSLNPDEPSLLAGYFDLPVVPTMLGFDPVFQLIHRDDCIEALVRGTLGGRQGAFNIAGENALTLTALLDGAGKVHAPLLPPAGAALISSALARLGVAALSPPLIDLLRWGRTLDTSRAARELGFRTGRDTMTALDDYVQQRRVLQFQPSGRRYMYERELEDYIHDRRIRRRAANGARLKLAEEAPTEPARGLRPRPRR